MGIGGEPDSSEERLEVEKAQKRGTLGCGSGYGARGTVNGTTRVAITGRQTLNTAATWIDIACRH